MPTDRTIKTTTPRIIAQSLFLLVGSEYYFFLVNEAKWVQHIWAALLLAGFYLAVRLLSDEFQPIKSGLQSNWLTVKSFDLHALPLASAELRS